MRKPILITGYTFGIKQSARWLEHVSNSSDYRLVIPERWIGRGGRIAFDRTDIAGMPTSRRWAFRLATYPFGVMVFKGFMPGLIIDAIRYRPKIIYNGSEPTLAYALYSAVIARCIGAKHILFSWENIPLGKKYSFVKRLFYGCLARLSLSLSDVLVAGNKSAAEIFGPLCRSVVVLPFTGVDIGAFSPTGPRPEADDAARVTFTFAGGLDERKGLRTLTEAFRIVAQENQRVHLKIVGRGSLGRYLKDFVHAHALSSRVEFHDWVSNTELPGLFRESDVFVYPSIPYQGWEEQFGYSMVEAMACGIPVIASRSGSIPEVVTDRVTGILVAPGDTSDLVDAIRLLAEDSSLRRTLGGAAREDVEKRFAANAIARHYEEVFRRVLSSRND